MKQITTSIYNTEPAGKVLEAFNTDDMCRVPEICNGLAEGVSILDTDLKIVDVNYTMKKWYSDRRSIIGQKCYSVFHNRRMPCENCPAIRTIERCTHERAVVVHETINAERVGVQDLQTFPVMNDNGEVTLIIEYISDVTVLRDRSRELAQANREIARLRMQNVYLEEKAARAESLSRMICKEIRDQLDSVVKPQLDDLRSRVSSLDKELIDEAIQTMYEPVINPVSAEDNETGNQKCPDLTMREAEVLRFTKEGHTSKEIARMLSVSPRTVDYHRQQLRRKLDLCGDSRRLSTRLVQTDPY